MYSQCLKLEIHD
uniref:Uncharacterized protein n=1 Tax=Arundo donax TaxID=35708 RepID=A0A0A9F936_ARUDO